MYYPLKGEYRCFFLTSTTYALSLSPVAMCLEELIPSNHSKFNLYSMGIRTVLVVSTLLVGLSVPFFGESFLFLCIYTWSILILCQLNVELYKIQTDKREIWSGLCMTFRYLSEFVEPRFLPVPPPHLFLVYYSSSDKLHELIYFGRWF